MVNNLFGQWVLKSVFWTFSDLQRQPYRTIHKHTIIACLCILVYRQYMDRIPRSFKVKTICFSRLKAISNPSSLSPPKPPNLIKISLQQSPDQNTQIQPIPSIIPSILANTQIQPFSSTTENQTQTTSNFQKHTIIAHFYSVIVHMETIISKNVFKIKLAKLC